MPIGLLTGGIGTVGNSTPVVLLTDGLGQFVYPPSKQGFFCPPSLSIQVLASPILATTGLGSPVLQSGVLLVPLLQEDVLGGPIVTLKTLDNPDLQWRQCCGSS